MHLWPSTKLRDSFKINYLKKLEWNLYRMNTEQQQQQQNQSNGNKQQLLENNKTDSEKPEHLKIGQICGELALMMNNAAEKTSRKSTNGALKCAKVDGKGIIC
ncbi:calmodulin 5 [Striga asiatica]|uniref:Calmodulin 5 n=1 Tax=Striga asiatica TaxID=4170 RepID=A0A5A7R3G1_STRAF|nr:calmodulin 5 [Striga asiatica]